ncbi:MAG: hypothetical protein ACI37P_06795, partial [Eggerthellaceae bacterium]
HDVRWDSRDAFHNVGPDGSSAFRDVNLNSSSAFLDAYLRACQLEAQQQEESRKQGYPNVIWVNAEEPNHTKHAS